MKRRRFTDDQIVKMLRAIVVFSVSALAACRVQPPDTAKLYDSVATLVTESTPRTDGKVVILDPDNLARLPSPLAAMIEERASSVYSRVVVLHVADDLSNLPGNWNGDKDDSTMRRNTTHLVLLVDLAGEGEKRSLRWDFLCGTVCGWGESVTLSWNGQAWTVRTESSRLY